MLESWNLSNPRHFPLNSKCRYRSPSVLLCAVWWWKFCLINYRTDEGRATHLYPAFIASSYVIVCCRFRFSAPIFGGAAEAGGGCSGVASELDEGRGRAFEECGLGVVGECEVKLLALVAETLTIGILGRPVEVMQLVEIVEEVQSKVQ